LQTGSVAESLDTLEKMRFSAADDCVLVHLCSTPSIVSCWVSPSPSRQTCVSSRYDTVYSIVHLLPPLSWSHMAGPALVFGPPVEVPSPLEEAAATVRSQAIGAMHAACAGSLLAGPAGDGSLEPHEGAADLVAERGVALLVLHAVEEAAAATGGGGGGVVVMMMIHVCGLFCGVLSCRYKSLCSRF